VSRISGEGEIVNKGEVEVQFAVKNQPAVDPEVAVISV